MKKHLAAITLLIAMPPACANAQQTADPVIVPTLAAATLVPLQTDRDREFFVDEPSLLKIEQAVQGEVARAESISRLLNRPVRTDVFAATLVCPERALCRLPGDMFILSVLDVKPGRNDVVLRVRYTFNLTVRDQTMVTTDTVDITLVAAAQGWRVVSVVRPTTHE
jgi:hypothetical protein